MLQNQYNKKGSIGITIVMLVFCFMMSVSMAYHKQLQTETVVHKHMDYADRALDAAFSGVNYAIARIQSNKNVFNKKEKVLFISPNSRTTPKPDTKPIPSDWVRLDNNMSFEEYYDERDTVPPYRFKIGCGEDKFYKEELGKKFVYIKSIGEYIQYDGSEIIGSYTAQIIAECKLDPIAKTIKVKRYRKMNPNENKLFTFDGYYEE